MLCLPSQPILLNGGASIALSGGTPAGGSFFGTNVSSGSFTPSSLGTDTVYYTYTDGNNCADTASAAIVVYLCTGINELSSGSIVLFPNPATDALTLKANGVSGKITVTVYDAAGKRISEFTDEASADNYTHIFNVKEFAKGSYLANIKTANGTLRYNFMVQ